MKLYILIHHYVQLIVVGQPLFSPGDLQMEMAIFQERVVLKLQSDIHNAVTVSNAENK